MRKRSPFHSPAGDNGSRFQTLLRQSSFCMLRPGTMDIRHDNNFCFADHRYGDCHRTLSATCDIAPVQTRRQSIVTAVAVITSATLIATILSGKTGGSWQRIASWNWARTEYRPIPASKWSELRVSGECGRRMRFPAAVPPLSNPREK